MKTLVISVLVCMLCLPMAVAARRDTEPPEWTFDDVLELSDWQDYHSLAPALNITKVKDAKGNERSVFVLNLAGDNPYIYPGGSVPNWESFNGYDYSSIYIGVRVSESDEWQVDYITSRNEEYDGKRSQKFRVDATKDFVDIEFEMYWDGMVSGFRIHPGTDINEKTEIDYVSLRGPVLATQAPRKLATTWGRIKDLF